MHSCTYARHFQHSWSEKHCLILKFGELEGGSPKCIDFWTSSTISIHGIIVFEIHGFGKTCFFLKNLFFSVTPKKKVLEAVGTVYIYICGDMLILMHHMSNVQFIILHLHILYFAYRPPIPSRLQLFPGHKLAMQHALRCPGTCLLCSCGRQQRLDSLHALQYCQCRRDVKGVSWMETADVGIMTRFMFEKYFLDSYYLIFGGYNLGPRRGDILFLFVNDLVDLECVCCFPSEDDDIL